MAFNDSGISTGTLVAAADYSSNQFYLVKTSTSADLTAVICAASSDVVLGVLNNKPKSGQACDIQTDGVAKVILGNSVTRGDRLMSDSSGKAITCTGNNPSFGKALESGSANDIRSVELGHASAGTTVNFGTPATETYAATVSVDTTKPAHRIAGANGTSATSTFNATTTGTDGDLLIVEVTSDSGGTCTITFSTNFKPSATLAVTASHYAAVLFRSDGTNWKEISRSAIIAS